MKEKTTSCPTCEGTGKVHMLFGTCPVTPSMTGEIIAYLHNKTIFSQTEMEVLHRIIRNEAGPFNLGIENYKPNSMTDREWKEFKEKLQ